MNEKEYLTKEKQDELKKELETLVHVRRKEVAEQLEYAKSLGDLSENAEYHEARDMQGNIEDRIAKIEQILKTAVITPSSHDTSAVTVGSVVTLVKEKDASKKVYTIVGSEESDMAASKISMKSPLGMAVLGKRKSDSFTVNTPVGPTVYKVVDIM